ncbi:MAG: hypothetical protein ACI4D8_09150 [Wujia sp.]
MKVNDALYTYGIKDKKLKKAVKRMRRGERINKLHAVVLPVFGDGLLEIYEYNQLLQPFYKSLEDEIHVVGIAMSKGEAINLVTDMVQDIYDSDCDFDVQRFFNV